MNPYENDLHALRALRAGLEESVRQARGEARRRFFAQLQALDRALVPLLEAETRRLDEEARARAEKHAKRQSFRKRCDAELEDAKGRMR